MTKKWTAIQNTLATLLLTWAIFFIYSFTYSALRQAGKAVQQGMVTPGGVSYVTMLRVYNVYLLCGILAGYAGIALMFEKKGGWLASIAASLIFMCFMLVSARDGLIAATTTQTSGFSVSYLITGLVFAAIFILLILKPFRQKYNPSLLNWLAIAGILLLVFADKKFFAH